MNRAADVTRRVVIPLAEVQDKIPRNAGGDPAFETLTHTSMAWYEKELEENKGALPSILGVFTPSQVVAIVNRWLYQAEYQQVTHRKRAQEQQRIQKPVKEAFRRLFPNVSFINATPEQITAAVKAAAEREV